MLRFVKEQDELGHPIGLTFKGEEKHQSLIGGVLSVVLTIFTLTILIINLEKVFTMSDPTITTFLRPMTPDKRNEIGNINLKDQQSNFAFKI